MTYAYSFFSYFLFFFLYRGGYPSILTFHGYKQVYIGLKIPQKFQPHNLSGLPNLRPRIFRIRRLPPFHSLEYPKTAPNFCGHQTATTHTYFPPKVSQELSGKPRATAPTQNHPGQFVTNARCDIPEKRHKNSLAPLTQVTTLTPMTQVTTRTKLTRLANSHR